MLFWHLRLDALVNNMISNRDMVFEYPTPARVERVSGSLGGSRGVWYRPLWLCRRSAAAGAGCAQHPAAGRIAPSCCSPQGVKKLLNYAHWRKKLKDLDVPLDLADRRKRKTIKAKKEKSDFKKAHWDLQADWATSSNPLLCLFG